MKNLISILILCGMIGQIALARPIETIDDQETRDQIRAESCVRSHRIRVQLMKNNAALEVISEYDKSNGKSDTIESLRNVDRIDDDVLVAGVGAGAAVSGAGAASLAVRKFKETPYAKKRYRGASFPHWSTLRSKSIIRGGVLVAIGAATVSLLVDQVYANSSYKIAQKEILARLDATQKNPDAAQTRRAIAEQIQAENSLLTSEAAQLDHMIIRLTPSDLTNPDMKCTFRRGPSYGPFQFDQN